MTMKYPVTPEGLEKLNVELRQLKTVDRPEIIKIIANARELGDLSENAEYHSAKEKQGFIEGKIADLEDKISRAEVIDITKLEGDDVKFGATVELCDLDSEMTIKYKIVGADEADIKLGYISFTSPISNGLIGKRPGDIVDIRTPGGVKSYEIVNVLYR